MICLINCITYFKIIILAYSLEKHKLDFYLQNVNKKNPNLYYNDYIQIFPRIWCIYKQV